MARPRRLQPCDASSGTAALCAAVRDQHGYKKRTRATRFGMNIMTGHIKWKNSTTAHGRYVSGGAGEVGVRFDLGRGWLEKQDIYSLSPGSMVQLDTPCDQEVDVYADGVLAARGELVCLDGKFAVRVTEVFAKDADTNRHRDAEKRQQDKNKGKTSEPRPEGSGALGKTIAVGVLAVLACFVRTFFRARTNRVNKPNCRNIAIRIFCHKSSRPRRRHRRPKASRRPR